MRKTGVATLALVTVLAGCGSAQAKGSDATHKPSTITVHGTVTINDTRGSFGPGEGGTCTPEGGWDDINQGAPVTIENASGKTIAVGKLKESTTDLPPIKNGDLDRMVPTSCVFPFNVTGVPQSKFYKVTVTHRGAVTFTRAEAKKGVHLSLGD